MILDISSKAAKALHQYIKLVMVNYELAMDEQNAAIRRKWLIAGWHAACAAETYVSDHSAKLRGNGFEQPESGNMEEALNAPQWQTEHTGEVMKDKDAMPKKGSGS